MVKALSLGLLFGLCILGAVDGQNGDSCKNYRMYDCSKARAYDDLELAEITSQMKRSLNPRDVDFSGVDQDTIFNFNLTNLVHRNDFNHLSGDDLHSKVEEILRDLDIIPRDTPSLLQTFKELTARTDSKHFCEDEAKMTYRTPNNPVGTWIYDSESWDDCKNFAIVKHPNVAASRHSNKIYNNEHVLERQIISRFADSKISKQPSPDGSGHRTLCHYVKAYWDAPKGKSIVHDKRAWDYVGSTWPKNDDAGRLEMTVIEKETNGMKMRLFKGVQIKDPAKMKARIADMDEIATPLANLKAAILLSRYLDHGEVNQIYKTQAIRVHDAMLEVENVLVENWKDDEAPYRKIDMHAKWLAFMKEYTENMITRLEDFIKKWSDEVGKKAKEARAAAKDVKTLPKAKQDLLEIMEATAREGIELTKPGRTKKIFNNPF